MKRITWIVGHAFALAGYLGATVLCIVTLAAQRHLQLGGWLFLLTNLSVIWIAFRYVRFRVQESRTHFKRHAAA